MISDGLPEEFRFRRCSVEIRPVTEGKDKILLGHFPTGDDAVVNLYLEQFLSILTNQHVIFNSLVLLASHSSTHLLSIPL